MTGKGKRTTLIVVSLIIVFGLVALYAFLSSIRPGIALAGVVLVQNQDPQKQVPVFDAKVAATFGKQVLTERSNASGFFRFPPVAFSLGQKVSLAVLHPDFQKLDLPSLDPNRLCIARLTPNKRASNSEPNGGPVLSITNIRLRYTVKALSTVNIGSIVRSFEVQNKGDVPCADSPVCSPDGKWRASIRSVTYDAGNSNQFTNVRSSCISGPCVFTQVEGSNIANPGRYIHITIRNWSDTVTFLVESEVSRTMEADLVRQAFPATFGTSMEFTLPPTAEGPSIEAELNGTNIVFPLGPSLLLSWATCTQETSPGRTRLFRCELKPSFAFR